MDDRKRRFCELTYKSEGETITEELWWHLFGFDADGDPVAIVEFKDGRVETVCASTIKFLDV